MADAKWTNNPGARLTANGESLEYACYGPPPGEAPTLVLLHEGLGCVTLWRDLPQKLADATGVILDVDSLKVFSLNETAMFLVECLRGGARAAAPAADQAHLDLAVVEGEDLGPQHGRVRDADQLHEFLVRIIPRDNEEPGAIG
mgnify:CR=1 FL=1